MSRHPSIAPLRKTIQTQISAVYRHGSTTVLKSNRKEINTIEGVENASSKFLMKRLFLDNNIKSPEFYFYKKSNLYRQDINNVETLINKEEIPFPLVAKLNFSSRGRGMILIKTQKEFDDFIKTKFRHGYYFERYYTYSREYRLHVSKNGCFYSCRKMLKSDTKEEDRWYRNDSNSVWITQFERILNKNGKFLEFSQKLNPEFNQPTNWEEICEHCIKALQALKLDIGAVDLKIQTDKTSKNKVRENQQYIILEINSAPSMGDITLIKYKEELINLTNV